jgi:hypothetical protein
MATGRALLPDDLKRAVSALFKALRENATNLRSPSSEALYQAYDDLNKGVKYAADRLQWERIRLRNLRQFNYPGTMDPTPERSTHNLLAPTMAGNIGRTMRSYAITRYNLDLDIFWTRLQKAIQQASSDYYAALQDAKVQVDALVVLCWLTALFTAIWSVAFVFVYPSVRAFLAVAIAGPMIARGLYLAACHHYRVFADLVRGCVDLFRFALIADLRLALPYGIDEERDLWKVLGDRTAYDDETWKPIYTHSGRA